MSEVRARLGMAAELDALDETDAAIDQLKAVVAAKPSAPYGATALAWLRLGAAYDRMGDARPGGRRRTGAPSPPRRPTIRTTSRAQARDAMRRQPDASRAEAYRLSIEGWRALERHALGEAQERLDRSAALDPADAVTAYRRALLLLARHRDQDALAALERVIAWRPAPPPTVLAASSLEAARLLEAAGTRDRAIEMYQRASRLRGADTETRQAAEKALDRLHAPRGPR